MHCAHRSSSLFAALILAVSILTLPASASTPIDETLYTSYFFDGGFQNVSWVVCGSTQQTEGCYSSGRLGSFGKVGAMLEGNPTTDLATNTVTRSVYVVDVAAGTGGTGVTLYVYRKKDVISATYDTTTVTLAHTLDLPALTGGSTAICSLAGTSGYLFIGTNQSPNALSIQKSNLAIFEYGSFSPPINVTSITADKYGYVTITYGGFTSGDNGFITIGPDGKTRGDGGGAWFMVDTQTAVSTSALPAAAPGSATRSPDRPLIVRPKKAPAE